MSFRGTRTRRVAQYQPHDPSRPPRRLVDEGLLLRQQGRGTVVAHVRINKQAHVSGFMSFSECAHRGLEPFSRILAFKSEVADAAVAAQLDLPLGAQVILLKRVRLANGEPMALERCYLPFERFRRLLSFDLSSRSLYDILETEFDTRATFCQEPSKPLRSTCRKRRDLGVKRGAPALLVTRVTRDAGRRSLKPSKQPIARTAIAWFFSDNANCHRQWTRLYSSLSTTPRVMPLFSALVFLPTIRNRHRSRKKRKGGTSGNRKPPNNHTSQPPNHRLKFFGGD